MGLKVFLIVFVVTIWVDFLNFNVWIFGWWQLRLGCVFHEGESLGLGLSLSLFLLCLNNLFQCFPIQLASCFIFKTCVAFLSIVDTKQL